MELNKFSDDHSFEFPSVRRAIKRSANSLIVVLLLSFLVVVFKAIFLCKNWTAFLNSIAIVLVFASFSVLFDLTNLTLHLPPSSALKRKIQKKNKRRSRFNRRIGRRRPRND